MSNKKLSKFLLSNALAFAALSAFAHTVSVSSVSYTPGVSSSNFNIISTYGFSTPGTYTMQTKGSFDGKATNVPGSDSCNASFNSSVNVTYAWNLIWTPSVPTDTPTGDVVLQQRYLYSLGATMIGNILDSPSGQVETTFVNNAGLPGREALCTSTSSPVTTTNGTTWSLGTNVVVSDVSWTLQTNGTYTATVPLPTVYAAGVVIQTTTFPNTALNGGEGSCDYTAQATLISVDDVNFTPYN